MSMMINMLHIRNMGGSLATHVIILNEIAHPEHRPNGWRLCLQWVRYQYDDGSEPEARIPSLADAELLIRLAREMGWGDRHADDAIGHDQ
jgi:hypothetical protein